MDSKVTIVLSDGPDGMVNLSVDFEPEVRALDTLTAAQYTAFKMLEAVRVEQEGDGDE